MDQSSQHDGKSMPSMKYSRFFAMIAAGTIIMYGLMYLNVYGADHIFFSQTRAWMALIMGATMAVVMLAFMWSMYPDRKVNLGILAGSAVVFGVALWLVRSQATVNDVSYMKAMIPHHSIAILTSERAGISDPRVRKLADGIIATQKKEIGEMEGLIQDLRAKR
jgi:FlaA1/EpsC-like NDP-sugar epimerase